MLMINEFGCEVNVDEAAIEQIKARGVWNLFKPSPRVYYGKGPAKSICLLLNHNGIGDAIHAMPAIWQKLNEGFDITVYADPFVLPCFHALIADNGHRCTVRSAEAGMLEFIPNHINEFGVFYSLKHWCISHDEETRGYVYKDRFDQIADYIEVKTPARFDWREFLAPDPPPWDTGIILGLESTSMQRSYPRRSELINVLNKRGLHYTEIGITGGSGAKTINEMISIVEGASAVIAVDSAVLALALALRKPTVALLGPTDAKIIAEQFNRFYPIRLSVLQSVLEDVCKRPCNFMKHKGFGVEGKCMQSGTADCMMEIMPEAILAQPIIQSLFEGYTSSKQLELFPDSVLS